MTSLAMCIISMEITMIAWGLQAKTQARLPKRGTRQASECRLRSCIHFALPVKLEQRPRAIKSQIEATPEAAGQVGIALTQRPFCARRSPSARPAPSSAASGKGAFGVPRDSERPCLDIVPPRNDAGTRIRTR